MVLQGVRMFPKSITKKKGKSMKAVYLLQGQPMFLSKGRYPPIAPLRTPCSKNPVMKCVVSMTIFLLLFNFFFLQFLFYSEAAEPTTQPNDVDGVYTATWTFGDPDDFNATETTIANNEVILKSYDYEWNQTSKNDFDKGEGNNVTISQKSQTEVVFSDDFENSNIGWEHGILHGTKDQWQRGGVSGIPEFIGTHDSGSYVWGTNLGGKYDDSGGTPSDYFLKSPNINLSNSRNTEMSFWHYYDFENDTNAMDGGRVEISIDEDGSSWVPVSPIPPGYDSLIESDDNYLHGEACFTGNSSSWVEERFDLSDYDGAQYFSVRFRFATNGQVSDYGWYIDDIKITSTTYSDGEVELDTISLEIGNPPDIKIQGPKNVTIIDTNNPANVNGTLTEWTVHIHNFIPPAKGKMKIFREVEGAFVLVNETENENISKIGGNTFTCSIGVKAGDYIGWYSENAEIFAKSDGSAYNMSGDINQTKPISDWTAISYTFPIRAEGIFRNPVGNLTSQVFDAGSPAIWEEIKWGEDLPSPDVHIWLQTRTGHSSDPMDSSWSPWSSQLSTHEGSAIVSPNRQYIQFKAVLTTEKQPYTPTLFNVNISYRKYSPSGYVETNDFIPREVDEIPDTVVQWQEFSAVENGQDIDYDYSLDSGETWHPIPANGDLRTISVLEGKIRLRLSLSTADTTVSPVISEMSITYSSATPDMGLYIEVDKKEARPGDMISYTIYYHNKGIGNASDVSITLELDANLSFRGDNSGVSPTIEKGKAIRWQFDIVAPANRTLIVDTRVKELREETTLTTYAILNYTDIGGNTYEGVISNTITIKVTTGQDLFLYYLLLGLIIAIVLASIALLITRRFKAMAADDEKIASGDVEKGIGYLIMEENPTKSYTLFSDLIDQGHKGLCITRAFPGRVKLNYSFEGVSILWLSRTRDDNSILPTNLGAVLRSAKDFIDENKDAVILLDGLEYLMVHNDFQKVLKLVHGINELIAINDAVLIMPLNPLTMDEDKVALLKRDLKILGRDGVLDYFHGRTPRGR